MPWIDDPTLLLASLPLFALPLAVALSAALEYVVPPFWGDLLVLFGFFLAGQGAGSPWLVFVAAFLGSLVGAAVAYLLGRRYGLALARRLTILPQRGAAGRVRRLYGRFGERVLAVNRFVPVVRGLMLYGAGAFHLRLDRALLYASLSNLLWLGLLMATGLLTAGTWPEILATFRRTSAVSGAIGLLVAAIWVGLLAWRLRGRVAES